MERGQIGLIGAGQGNASVPAIFANSVRGSDSGLNGDDFVGTCLAAVAEGDLSAYFDLGVAYSTGSHGVECDLIEAHKWFNLAAVAGDDEAALCRHDVAEEMSARQIAEAQRRAREWIAATSRRAA